MLREDVLKLLKRGGGAPVRGGDEPAAWCEPGGRLEGCDALRDGAISSHPLPIGAISWRPPRPDLCGRAGRKSGEGCVLGQELICLDTVDSTNSEVKSAGRWRAGRA